MTAELLEPPVAAPPQKKSSCFFIKLSRQPTVTVAYTCVSQGPNSWAFAKHFRDTYLQFHAHAEHELYIICNGGALPRRVKDALSGLRCEFYERTNDGWDIGGYQALCRGLSSDLMLCLGESVYFHRAGWLKRITDTWLSFGAGMYGCFSSFLASQHMNTSAFAVTPMLMATNHEPVYNRDQRYGFEHGPRALWRRLRQNHFPTKLVTWDGVYDPPHWRNPPNILWRGDQSNCLVFCNHTDRYFAADRSTKQNWSSAADTFRL